MAKPEDRDRGRALFGPGLLCLGVAVTVVAVAALAVSVLCLDARRQHQVADLTSQLDTLRQLVDSMQKQLDRHEEKINSTIHAKSTTRNEPAEETVYEDEYEYDDEEGSYEYDEDEPNPKATVKRTIVLSESTPSSSEMPRARSPAPLARTRRDLTPQDVPVKEERYVPSTSHLKDIFKDKSEGLRIYATYFGKTSKYLGSPEQVHHLKYSKPESFGNNGPNDDTISSNQRSHLYSHQIRPSKYQEQRRPGETVVRLRHGGRNKNANMDDVELISQNSEEEFPQPLKPSVQQPKILAAHFVGDASNYNTRDHYHYYGNNILFHPHGLFKDWVPSSWMFELGTNFNFPLHNGKLNIQNTGLYFVYAQVYYAATHDRCGFHIKHNGEEVAQCMTMSTGRMVKRNTCFTAVIVHLHKSDLLWVSEVEGYRNTSFKNSHSFFGLLQLKSFE